MILHMLFVLIHLYFCTSCTSNNKDKSNSWYIQVNTIVHQVHSNTCHQVTNTNNINVLSLVNFTINKNNIQEKKDFQNEHNKELNYYKPRFNGLQSISQILKNINHQHHPNTTYSIYTYIIKRHNNKTSYHRKWVRQKRIVCIQHNNNNNNKPCGLCKI